jgi:beta-galactosidase
VITRHSFGNGAAYYLGTQPEPGALARVLHMAVATAGVEPAAQVPPGVEAVRRSGRGKSFLFLLNHRDVGVDVPILEAGADLVGGGDVHPGLLHLEPRGVAVIREGW